MRIFCVSQKLGQELLIYPTLPRSSSNNVCCKIGCATKSPRYGRIRPTIRCARRFLKTVQPFLSARWRRLLPLRAARGRLVLADDMGLGKTIQGVGTAEFLAREAEIKKVLIICPASRSAWRS